MAIRTISWTVAEDMSVTPMSIQKAGVQGDDRATCAEFTLPVTLQEGHDFYIELTTAMGGYDKTDALSLSDGKVSFLLPREWTQDGGKAVLRLVAEEQTEDGVEPATIHSEPCRIVFSERATGFARVKALVEGSIHRMMEICKKAVNRVEEITVNIAENVKGSIAESCYRIIEQNQQAAVGVWIGTVEQHKKVKGTMNNMLEVVLDDPTFDDIIRGLEDAIENTKNSCLPISGGTLTGKLFTQYGMPVLDTKVIDYASNFNELLPPGVYYLSYFLHENSPEDKEMNGILYVFGNYSSKYLLQFFYWFGSEAAIDIAPETYVRKIRGNGNGGILFGKWNQIH